jgi:dissimilatory sulfite reductase (desulfoviridin) alpha/beta subunit
VAIALDQRYFGRTLPHKFKFGVTGCQNNCLKAEENDVGVKGAMSVRWEKEKCVFCGVCEKVCRQGAVKIEGESITLDESLCNHCGRCVKSCPTDSWTGESGYLLSFGGTFGNQIQKGAELLPLIRDQETLFRVTDAAIDFFDQNARPGERFAKTIDRVGWDKLQTALEEAYHG